MGHVKNCDLACIVIAICIIRDLGPVKGGKGLKHHEVVVDFSCRALTDLCSSDGAGSVYRHFRPK